MKTELQKLISELTDLTHSEISEFMEICSVKTIQPKSHFITTGEVPKKFGFVLKGLFRYVYISEKGTELTKGFMPEKSFISSYSSMISKTPSYFFIEALETSVILSVTLNDWEKLIRKKPIWNQLLLKLLEKGYMVKEKRERELLLFDAETRYRIFLEEFPSLEDRLKQHMIASYLGITPIALSRIRKKMKA